MGKITLSLVTLWITQFAQSFDLNLADTLTGKMKDDADFIKGERMSIFEAIAHLDDRTFTGIENSP